MENLRAAVVFHSVCGNTYRMARIYSDQLRLRGVQTDLFRVDDPHYDKFSVMFEAARRCKAELEQVRVLDRPAAVEDYDLIFLGSPTYFGNVSAAMKAFMDAMCDLWCEARLYGKYFGCFTTASTAAGGGPLCLQAMNTFAQHMGMTVLAAPADLSGVAQPAYGMIHYSGALADCPPDGALERTAAEYIERLLRCVSRNDGRK